LKKEFKIKNSEILAIIPARGGSKGINKKNIKKLKGKPLLEYTSTAALKSKYISRVILSTEDKEISKIGRDLGVEVPFLRSKNLAKDTTPSLIVFKEVLKILKKKENYIPDYVVILQPTSPFRTTDHIDEAIFSFLNSTSDSLVSVVEVPHNFNPLTTMKLNKNKILKNFIESKKPIFQRQKKPKFYARNGAAIYITTPDCILNKNSLLGKKIMGFTMSKLDSIDIDDNEDWTLAEALLNDQ